jgi:hypothetical protein
LKHLIARNNQKLISYSLNDDFQHNDFQIIPIWAWLTPFLTPVNFKYPLCNVQMFERPI